MSLRHAEGRDFGENENADTERAVPILDECPACQRSSRRTVDAPQQNLAGIANDRTIVEGDVNGDKKADFAIELKGLVTLSAANFVL